MIETLIIAGSIGLMISGVMLAISRNAWRATANKLRCSVNYLEGAQKTAQHAIRRLGNDIEVQRQTEAALIGDREVLRKQLEICEKTITTLRNDVAEFRASEQTRQTAEKEAQDDRFSEVAKCSKCEAELTIRTRDKERLERQIARNEAANELLRHECKRMDGQLTAIKNALVTQPEPTE